MRDDLGHELSGKSPQWTDERSVVGCFTRIHNFQRVRSLLALIRGVEGSVQRTGLGTLLARAWAVLLFVFGSADLYHLYHPHVPTPDEYFGILYDPVLMFGGAAWIAYLLLPKVKAHFRSRSYSR